MSDVHSTPRPLPASVVGGPCPALDALVAHLDGAFDGPVRAKGEGDPSGRRIAALLAEYAAVADDWRPYALFHAEAYTRNLVARGERYELLLLCWGEGQESPIHNHEGQDCWMAVLEGELEEQRFAVPAPGAAGPLAVREVKAYTTGEVGFIRDEMGLHRVAPLGSDGFAVSMHLYAAPYGECNVYCPDTGRVERRRLVDFSHRGRVLAPPPA